MNLGHIMYSQLDGRYHAFLLTGLIKPKALAIDPVEGYEHFTCSCCDIFLKEIHSKLVVFVFTLLLLLIPNINAGACKSVALCCLQLLLQQNFLGC